MILASPIYGAVLTRDTADLNSAVTKRWYGEMDKREAAWIICLNVFRNQRKAREDDWAAYQAARVSCEGQFGHDIGSVLDTNYDRRYILFLSLIRFSCLHSLMHIFYMYNKDLLTLLLMQSIITVS